MSTRSGQIHFPVFIKNDDHHRNQFGTLIDDQRALDAELATMRDIKAHLFESRPEARELIRPTIYRAVHDIPPHAGHSALMEAFFAHGHPGTQWDWIGRFVLDAGIDDLEVCLVRADAPTYRSLESMLPADPPVAGKPIRLLPEKDDGLVYPIFRYYRFPLIYTTKLEIGQLAKHHGFAELLERTWFCHRPRRGRVPCGTCTPCRAAIKLGMGHRVPRSSHLGLRARAPLQIDRIKRLWKNRSRSVPSADA